MRKRIITGVVLAALLFGLISFLDAWPLRVGLAYAFAMCAFELFATAAWGHLAGLGGSEKNWRHKEFAYLQFAVAIIAGVAIMMSPIRASEMLALAIAAFMGDIWGLVIGVRFGKKRMYALGEEMTRKNPRSLIGRAVLDIGRTSMKKTLEGYVGGLVGSLVTTWLFLLFTTGFDPVVPKVGLLLLGGLVGCTGDLLGSAAKRQLGIKDADAVTKHLPVARMLERLMDGHGGYLDRLDSFGLVVVFYYVLLMITGAL